MALSIPSIEAELRKRTVFPYRWHGRQNRNDDNSTNFIYDILPFDQLEAEVEHRFGNSPRRAELRDYALNRWFNYWSARAVEEIFSSQPGVAAATDPTNHDVDFAIDGVQFDHKTTVYPAGFTQPLSYAKANPRVLIRWLYENQSQENRRHYYNRLFVVLCDSINGEHWKLRAGLGLIEAAVVNYVSAFDPTRLESFDFGLTEPTLSDVIWVVV